MAPFHIKAQILRQAQLEPAAALGVFAERAGEADRPSRAAPPTGKASWRQSDVKRVLAAACQAGLQSYRVEVAPDGTISLVVGEAADTAPPPRPTPATTSSRADARHTLRLRVSRTSRPARGA